MLLEYVTNWDGGRIREYLEMSNKGQVNAVGPFRYWALGGWIIRAVEPHEAAPGSLHGVKWEMTR